MRNSEVRPIKLSNSLDANSDDYSLQLTPNLLQHILVRKTGICEQLPFQFGKKQ